jgi:sugar lactone lactonase YvrE
LTDSASNQVYRFDGGAHTFRRLMVHRSLSAPNGIALADDDRQLFVADDFGVVRVDLDSGASMDVIPGPRNTLAGIDGLYWHKGSLIAVQNGIGSPRIAAFRLSRDGSRVTQTIVLENRTAFTTTPTTGALHGNDFYFIANSQVDNLNGDKILDVTKLAPVRIAVVRLP